MQRIELTYLQMTLIGMGVGLVLGLIPLTLGIVKGKKKLAIGGFFASIAAGAAWSLFSLVTVIVFVWLILRKPAEPVKSEIIEDETVETEVGNRNPVDESVKDAESPSVNRTSDI